MPRHRCHGADGDATPFARREARSLSVRSHGSRALGQPVRFLPSPGCVHRTENPHRFAYPLRKKVGRRYLGVLPRMVLVSLEAWDRSDFRDYLRQLPWSSDAEWAAVVQRPG